MPAQFTQAWLLYSVLLFLFRSRFRLLLSGGQLFWLGLLIFRDSRLEFTHALAKRFAHERQFARSKDQQADSENQQKFGTVRPISI